MTASLSQRALRCALGALVAATAAVGLQGHAGAKALAQLRTPSGPELFKEHCAACHGGDGAGNGPMAAALKIAPADLTTIAKRANGVFPAPRVVEIIRYGGGLPGHGSPMPVWGSVFSEKGGRGKIGAAYSRRAVVALKRYLESIQRK